jgi:hypothetical protein
MNSTVRECKFPDSLTRCVVSAAGALCDIVRAHHLAYLRLGIHLVAMGEAQELEIGWGGCAGDAPFQYEKPGLQKLEQTLDPKMTSTLQTMNS